MEKKSFNIITERPEDMPYEDYKVYMRIQTKAIKNYLKGKYIWISRLRPTKNILDLVGREEYKDFAHLMIKGATYVKPKNK